MASTVTPSEDLAKQEDEVRNKLKSLTLGTVCKRKIILIKELLEWRAEEDRIKRFMKAMARKPGWKDEKRHQYVDAITSRRWLLLVLSLLIQLHESDRIDGFIRALPHHTSFSTISREDVERATGLQASDKQFVEKFEAQKWPFGPVILSYTLSHNLQRAEMLLFTQYERIDNSNGAYACVYLVNIPAQFTEEDLEKPTAAYRFRWTNERQVVDVGARSEITDCSKVHSARHQNLEIYE